MTMQVGTIGNQNILINPVSHYTYIGLAEPEYEGLWIEVDVEEPERKARPIWEPNTCVTQAKNFLGIQKRAIVTPYQLYRYLVHGWSIQKTESA